MASLIQGIKRLLGKTQLLGADITIYAPGETLTKHLTATEARVNSLADELDEFGRYLVDRHIPNQFALQGAPQPFAPLSPRYALRKALRWGAAPILYASGAMYNGFSYTVRGRNLIITNNKDYAAYHQTGTRKMPARKWLQLTDSDYNVLRKIMKEGIEGAR